MFIGADTLSLITTALIILIILSSILFGIKRGFKKTFFRFCWFVVTIILLYFLTPVVSNWLNNMDLSSFNINISGPVERASDIFINILNKTDFGAEAIANSAVFEAFVKSLPAMILNVILFVVLFWLLKWILWPLWAILSSRFFDKQKREKKKYKKQQEKLNKAKAVPPPTDDSLPIILQVQHNKNRGWGALFGLAIGLIICAATLSPFVGLNNIYQKIQNNVFVEESGQEVAFLSSNLDEEELKYLSFYENSFGSKILTYTGTGFFSNIFFEKMMVVELEGQKVPLSNEIDTAIKVYKNYRLLEDFDFDNLTKASIDDALIPVEQIFKDIKSSKILYLLGDELLPYYIDQEIENVDKIIDGGRIDEILKDAYANYDDFSILDLQTQVEAIVDIIILCNNYDLIVPIAKDEIDSFEAVTTLFAENILNSVNFADFVVENVYKVKLLVDQYPELISEGMQSIFNSLDLVFLDQEISPTNLKTNLKTFVKNSIDLAKYYQVSENYDFGGSSQSALKELGQIFDIFKLQFLSEENYQALLDYAINLIDEQLEDEFDVSEFTQKLKEIVSWENEFSSLSNLYKAGIKIYNSSPTLDDILDEESTLISDIGKGLESAMKGDSPSKIITNQNIKKLCEILLDKYDTSSIDKYLNLEVKGTKTLKEFVLDNIFDGSTSLVSEGWENEFIYNLNVFRKVYYFIKEDFDIDALADASDTRLKDLGASIDDAILNTKLLIYNEVIRNLIKNNIDEVDFPSELNKILFEIDCGTDGSGNMISVYDLLLNNIFSLPNGPSNVLSWESEFVKLKTVINKDFDTSNLEDFGKLLDDISGSKVLTSDIINTVVRYYIDREAETLDSDLLKTGGAIDTLKNNLGNVTSYEDEFGFLSGLIDVLKNDYDSDLEKFNAFGEEFNKICGITGGNGKTSVLLSKDVLNKFLKHFIDKYVETELDEVEDAGIIEIINTIEDNFDLIENYKTEFNNLYNLVECVKDGLTDKNEDGEVNLKDIGFVFDSINSKIITYNVKIDLLNFYIDKHSASLNDDFGIIEQIKSNLNEKTIVSFEFELGAIERLTDLLSSSAPIPDYEDVGEAFDEICNISNDPNKMKSEIITRSILNDFLSHYFDDLIEDNLDAENDEDLIDILESIKGNIPNINSFKSEFINIEELFDVVDETNYLTIGEYFNALKSKNSPLFTANKIKEIILYFFDKKVAESMNNENEFEDIISSIRTKISNTVDVNYKTLFNELESVMTSLDSFDIDSIEGFKNHTTMGANLDEMEKMFYACDKAITYQIAIIIFDKMLENLEGDLLASIEGILYGDIYSFDSYEDTPFRGSYLGENYYSDLINALKNKLNEPSQP